MLKTISGVIPPMITPFDKSGEVDYLAHIHNVKKWNTSELAGYLVLGSNSEAVYLNEKEKLNLIEKTAEYAPSNRIILAGTGMESTKETIHLTNEAARAGAHAALVVTPFYFRSQMTSQALIDHYTAIADASSIPILIYNVTKYTGINISPSTVGVLSQHPNIIGMKDSSGSIPQLLQFQASAASDFNILVGTASAWYPALNLGVKAAIMALANCAPEACIQVQQLFQEGKTKVAEALYRKIFPVNTAVTATFGVAGLKYACSQLGFKGGYVRQPLSELTDKEKAAIDGILTNADLTSRVTQS